ncbi:hypothetical protein C1646_774742 [Rhizophagus diaphanus]|nr:hypothetical protein C1646_774742 [Rhizophagus diaphanus] [Rhizophagus sp. MUCL 43196]
MTGIAIRYVTENEFNTEMSIEELSKHTPALDILLTDKVKRDQARRRLKKRYNFSEEQVFALIPKLIAGRKKGGALPNVPDTSDITQEAELDTVNTSEIKVIAKALAESASNASAEKNEERASQLLMWIQEAISSGQLRDLGKPRVLWFNIFLKKDEFLPEASKPLLPSSLRKLGAVFAVVAYGAKNLSEAITITSQALRHSPDNYASPAKNYIIVNFRRRGQPYDQAKAIKIFDEN